MFALLSGDSDFSPVVHKLKENDKRVIGCGVKSSTSNLLIASCDEFIYYDDLVRSAAERTRPEARKGGKGKPGDKKKAARGLRAAGRDRALAGEGVRPALGLAREADDPPGPPGLQRAVLRLPDLRRPARGRGGRRAPRARLRRQPRQLQGPHPSRGRGCALARHAPPCAARPCAVALVAALHVAAAARAAEFRVELDAPAAPASEFRRSACSSSAATPARAARAATTS